MKRSKVVGSIHLESLPCAAACLASGCRLIQIERLSPGRCQFTIAGENADLIAADFLLGKLEGNLQLFMRCFDDLRTAVRREEEVR